MRAKTPAILSDRDREILTVLTRRTRVLAEMQLARQWWSHAANPTASARKSLQRLLEAGLLQEGIGMAHPVLAMAAPVLSWSPGQSTPDTQAGSYRLQSRWTLAPENTRWYAATESAASLTGGFGGRAPRASELTHDIHLAELYLRLLTQDSTRAASWTSEADLFKIGLGRNQRLPDAIVRSGDSWLVIEFGGAYPAAKLREFHVFCEHHGLAYEIW